MTVAWTRVAGKTGRRFELTSAVVGKGKSQWRLLRFSESRNLGGSSCLLGTDFSRQLQELGSERQADKVVWRKRLGDRTPAQQLCLER